MARYRIVEIDCKLLLDIFTQGNTIRAFVKKGLPQGTKWAYAIPTDHYTMHVVVEHESFDDISLGKKIPMHPDIEIDHTLDRVK